MIEVDHSTLPANNPPPPAPAVPILGNHLLELEEKQRRRFTENGRPERVETGCREIDEVLGGKVGGVERGVVVGISSEDGEEEGRLLSLNLLATLLLSHLSPTTTQSSKPIIIASIIDTTGTFPLSLLAKMLKSRLSSNPSTKNLGMENSIQQCLEMVNLTRVFDLEGVWEVLSEISHSISNPSAPTREPEIPSSDASAHSLLHQSAQEPPQNDSSQIEIILITSITPPIHHLFATRSKTTAHDLLALLSRTLHTLTSTSNILTLIHNSVIPVRSNSNYPAQPSQNQPPKGVSVFSSNPLKPALGQIFTQFPSLHIMMSPMPKRREDAEILYAPAPDPNQAQTLPQTSLSKVKYTTILEILKDETPILGSDRESGEGEGEGEEIKQKQKKFGHREQRWTALEINREGTGLVCSFVDEGESKGAGKEREKERMGGLTERGKVIKMHGFGGRRV